MSRRLSVRQRELLAAMLDGSRIVWNAEDGRYAIVRSLRGPVAPTLRALERLGLAFSLDDDGASWYAASGAGAALADRAEP